MDLIEAIEQAKVVVQLLQNERQDDLVWDALYQEAVTLAAEFQVLNTTSSLWCFKLESLSICLVSCMCVRRFLVGTNLIKRLDVSFF